MDDRIRKAFEGIRAEEELKAHTETYLLENMRKKQERKARKSFGLAVSAAACLLLACVCFGGWKFYFTPTAAVSIDINPSVELEVNRFDRVLSVTGYNADGRELADSLDIRFLDCREAVGQILESETVSGLLSNDEILEITVAGNNNTQCGRILSQMKTSTEGEENVRCYSASMEDVEHARDSGLSLGKYRAFLEVQALDLDITPEEVRDMTMKEIRELIRELSGIGEDGSKEQNTGDPGRGRKRCVYSSIVLPSPQSFSKSAIKSDTARSTSAQRRSPSITSGAAVTAPMPYRTSSRIC